ncbi:MAG TPA: DUF3237 family protein [Acetivibrio clariflavus]|nr:DUF3237 family protein [Acetivibrio clariflavus]
MNFEEVLTVNVKIESAYDLKNDNGDSAVMILFTGNATGKYFEGNILPGGVDTQIIGNSGYKHTLSARYMIEGKDHTGENCRIFIENNGNFGNAPEGVLFRTYPKIITDSEALDFLNHALLVGEGYPAENGVIIKIFRAL